MDLEVQIQKMTQVINKLRLKYESKDAANKQLRTMVSRLRSRCNTLKELLDDLQEQNLLSSEAKDLLQVGSIKKTLNEMSFNKFLYFFRISMAMKF